MADEDSRVQRLAALDALIQAGSDLPRLVGVVTAAPVPEALAQLAELLQCGEAEARVVYSTPLRLFSPESRVRVMREAEELRGAIDSSEAH